MPARRLVIYGAGAPLAIDAEESCLRLGIEIAAAIRNLQGASYVSAKVRLLEADAIPDELKALGIVLPMFTPTHRQSALEDARRRGFTMTETVVDPTSAVASSTRLGAGVYVNAGCTIGGGGEIGDFVLINRAASIGHHARLEDFVSIGPGAVLAGSIRVGRGAVIGAGAVILPQIEIGAGATVGAGAVVTRSVPAGALAVGNPARVTRER
jgi:sugar O-acyltransferase (sialic acid O-acetyltransferase NeuD family)